METVRTYTVLISSPGDQAENRKLVAQEIEQYTKTYAASNIAYRSVEQDDVPSQFGGNPQQIINEYFDRLKVDVYIGLMGTRFGSSTESFGSGTEEEFNIAIEKNSKDSDFFVSFLFNKKPEDILDLTDEQLTQVRKVRQFKDSISSKGVYQAFTDELSLRSRVEAILKEHSAIASQKTSFQTELELLPPEALAVNESFFSCFVNSLDAEIVHNGLPIVRLSDVYVPLDVSPITHSDSEQKTEAKYTSIDTLISPANAENHYIIAGDEKAGKTTFCKSIFLGQKDTGFTPIYVTGDQIKNKNVEDFQKTAEKNYIQQYSAGSLEDYRKLQPKKKFIIIDNFGDAHLNDKNKILFLTELKIIYPNILITVDPTFLFNLNLSAAELFKNIDDFQIYELEDMGHKLRDNLIQKWIKLGCEETISDEQLYTGTQQKAAIINSIIGSNFVPRKPFIVLVLLQAIQDGMSNELKQSSFIRYYKFLIDSTLLPKLTTNESELAYELLPVIAYEMHKKVNRHLSESDFEELIENFADERGINKKELTDVKSSLLFVSMLMKWDGEIKFKHSYTFYFFVSQYFSINLNNSDTKQQVIDICSSLHLKQNANIIIFLSYHSNDPTIIDTVCSQIDKLFTAVDEFDFNTQASSAINLLVSQGPKLFLASKSEEYRRQHLHEMDLAEKREVDQSEDIAKEELDGNDYMAQTRLAYRSAEILGQLLKNHAYRFAAQPKKDLYLKSLNVGLRNLNQLIQLIADNQDVLVELIEQRFRGNSGKVEEITKFKRDVQKLVFNLAASIAFGMVKATAKVNGATTLSRTYEDILKENDALIYKVVDLAIKLDFFENFPTKELEKVYSECKDNNLAKTVVSNLVRYRLDMRPIDDFKLKQKVCDLVGISLPQQIKADKKKSA